MELLDQSDVDAMLETASGAAQEVGASDTAGQDVHGAQTTSSPDSTPELPPEFRLIVPSDQLARLLAIRVPVQVRLAERTMGVSKLLDLTVGTIIETDRRVDSDLTLVVNNIPIGTGNAVKCGENFGLRVIKIQPWAQQLLAEGLIR